VVPESIEENGQEVTQDPKYKYPELQYRQIYFAELQDEQLLAQGLTTQTFAERDLTYPLGQAVTQVYK